MPNINGIPNVMNPILESINSAIGSIVNTISANSNQSGPFQFTPAPPVNVPASNTNSTTSHDNSELRFLWIINHSAILDEVLNGTSSSTSEATEANPASDSTSHPAESSSQPAPTSPNDAQQLTVTHIPSHDV